MAVLKAHAISVVRNSGYCCHHYLGDPLWIPDWKISVPMHWPEWTKEGLGFPSGHLEWLNDPK
jgi:hypothetical protein